MRRYSEMKSASSLWSTALLPGVAISLAALLSSAVVMRPHLTFAAIAALVVVVLAMARPILAMGVGTLLFAVQLSDILPASSADITLLQKSFFLVVALVLIWQRGMRLAPLVPIVAVVAMWALSGLYAYPMPGNSFVQSLSSGVTLSIGWLIAAVPLDRSETQKMLYLVTVLPLASLLFGLLLSPFGFAVLVTDYSGAVRLQGATIPAYFAGLCVVALGAAIRLSFEQEPVRRTMVLLSCVSVVNFCLLALTGSRTAFMAAVILTIPYMWISVKHWIDSRVGILIARLVFLGLTAIGLYIYIPVLLSRSSSGASEVNLSGRTEAWAYFLDSALVSPGFGRGLGAGPLAASEGPRPVREFFTAQHNEYLRFFLEGGYVGILMCASSIVLLFFILAKRQPRIRLVGVVALAFCLAVYSTADNTLTSFAFFGPFGILVGSYFVGDEKSDGEGAVRFAG